MPGLAQKTRGELRLGWVLHVGSSAESRNRPVHCSMHSISVCFAPRMDEIDILASSLTLANQREQEALLFTKFQ